MRRLFVETELTEELTLTGSDAHHLGYSLRAKLGERVVIVFAGGRAALTEITSFTASEIKLKLIEEIDEDTESPLELILAMCLPKGEKMDFIVQKATELGASGIQPLQSTNCVVKYDEAKKRARAEKWQRVAAEAAKQCGRSLIPPVEPVVSLEEWLKKAKEENFTLLMASETETEKALKSALCDINDKRIFLLVGSEGGFTEAEREAAKEAGAISVTLGKRILRAETAAVAMLALVQYEKGDLGGGKR